jgi:hypothetical protein
MNVFTALLPPANGVAYEYYDILGLPKSSSIEDIRKAYKKKSLELHPDKVAQRGVQNAAEAAAAYERVQEAAGVLQDAKLRQTYHRVGCSVARYRFMLQGGIYNIGSVMENLRHAAFVDKTRLVLLVSSFICLVLLQPILIAAKVNAIVEKDTGSALYDTDWVVLMIPLWVLHGCVLVFWGLLAVMIPESDGQLTVNFLEQLCYYIGFFIVAQQWDRSRNADWNKLAVPFYLAIIFRIYGTGRAVSAVRRDQRRMVSPEHLEATEGRLEDLTESQRAAVEEKYIVVKVDNEVVVAALQAMSQAEDGDVTDEDLETLRVRTSNEYAESEHAIRALSGGTTTLLFCAIPFIALVAAKLEDHIDVDWVVVFVPIFVKLGWELSSSCFVCCSGPGRADTIIVMGDDEVDDSIEVTTAQETAVSENQAKGVNETNANKESIANFASTEGEMDVFNRSTGALDTPDIEVGKSNIEPKQNATSASGDKPSDGVESNQEHAGDNDEEDEDEPEIHIDEETYRAWQKVQAEMDASEIEARAKAQTTFCSALFQLIIALLVVFKLDDDYKNSDPNDTGYNAFWILFPVLLVAGLILCCCSCMIYGFGAPINDADEVESVDEEANDSPVVEEAVSAPAAAIPTAADDSTSKAMASVPATSDAPPTADVETGKSLNDLD